MCKTWPEFKTTESFLKQSLWSNISFTYNGKTVWMKNWIKVAFYLKSTFSISMRLSLNCYKKKDNWLCEYTIIQKVFKKYLKKTCDYSKIDFIHIEIDKLVPEKQNSILFLIKTCKISHLVFTV